MLLLFNILQISGGKITRAIDEHKASISSKDTNFLTRSENISWIGAMPILKTFGTNDFTKIQT